MTVEEIFSKLDNHIIKGLMIHEQMMNYYNFLGLYGYKKCHEYHYMCETMTHNKLNNYYITHYDKLIDESAIEIPEIIPSSWYKYTRQDVDASTKKNAVKMGLEKWVDWERETKNLYEEMFSELMQIGEVSGAMFVRCLIKDVDHELSKAEKYKLTKETLSYDISHIISEQSKKHEKYYCKLENMYAKCCRDK